MKLSRRARLSRTVATVLAAIVGSALVAPPTAALAAKTVTPPSATYGTAVSVTFYLPLRNEAAAEAQAMALQTPGNPAYHRFLSTAQFVAAYAPSAATVAKTTAALARLGYTIDTVYANNLAIEATAPASTVANTLSIRLMTRRLGDRIGVVPSAKPTLPASLAGLVRNVAGLDTLHVPHPLNRRAAIVTPATRIQAATGSATPAATTLTGGTPGNYLPADYAKRYDVTPITSAGISGRGHTLGIVTLANFYSSDAYTFWKEIGLAVSPTRISVADVDGGTASAPSDKAGEGETDIDVEESGGLAPGADVRVYISSNNTTANFINGFEAAASENVADTLSTSWGEPELYYYASAALDDPDETAQLQDFHDVFLELALQGQTLYVASGDSGSFDTVEDCPTTGKPTAKAPTCNAPYAVDSPADDPLVTAAGGTTTPFSMALTDGATLSVATERAWSWDYIPQEDPTVTVADVFSTGDGGGVSTYWPLPWYQVFTPGITLTKPNQSLTINYGSGSELAVTLPSYFAGRNMPDVSTDADPESGYQFLEAGKVQNFYGGTSFVAPQLNGVTALFVQSLGGRVGQISPALYALRSLAETDVTTGDNWGYNASFGFDNASGVGALDAARTLAGLTALRFVSP